MGYTFKFKRGLKVNLPSLQVGEPALTTDEKRFYMGSSTGNIGFPNIDEFNTLSGKVTNNTNAINNISTGHMITYKTVSTTVGQDGTGLPSITDWQHIKIQGADATLCVMVGITSATDSNPSMLNDALVNSAISSAYTAGVKIDMLKLHLGTNYSDGFNRGNYLPSNVSTYFTNWQTICLHYASICNTNNIPILCIGCEQPNQTFNNYLSNWATIRNAIKATYPNLLITYAPKTWEIENINNQAICSILDIIGYNIYLTYTQNPLSVETPTVDNLGKAFYNEFQGNQVMDTIVQLVTTYNKPIFITEIGCMPIDKGLVNVVPYDYSTENINYDSVAWLMKTAFNVLFRNLHIIGFAWWHTNEPFCYYNTSITTSAEQVMIDYVKGGLI